MWLGQGSVLGVKIVRSSRIRLIGQLVRPARRHLRQWGEQRGYQEQCSRCFSRFLITFRRSRPGDGPRSRSCTLGFGWHPVDLAQPDHTPARGQPSTEPAHASSVDLRSVRLCPTGSGCLWLVAPYSRPSVRRAWQRAGGHHALLGPDDLARWEWCGGIHRCGVARLRAALATVRADTGGWRLFRVGKGWR